jgi:hypothetical protein
VRLRRDGFGVPTEGAARVGKERRADVAKTLERVVAAVLGPVAVRPLVVARRVDERIVEAGEQAGDARVVGVGAAALAVLDVAEVDRDAHLRRRVDPAHPAGEGLELGRAVGDVADHRERERLGRAGRLRPRLRHASEHGGEDDDRDDKRASHRASLTRWPRGGESPVPARRSALR